MLSFEITRLKDGKKFYSLAELPEQIRNEVLDAGPTVYGGTCFCKEDECVYSWRRCDD